MKLRPLEEKTLAALRECPTLMTREDWLNKVYAGRPEPSLDTLKVTVSSLRKKGFNIGTVWGRGYVLGADQ